MRVSKNGESKSETVGVTATPTEKVALEKLAVETERSVSYWVGKFMRDGWAAYNAGRRGGDEENGNGDNGGTGGGSLGGRPLIDKMSSKNIGRKKSSKKREAS